MTLWYKAAMSLRHVGLSVAMMSSLALGCSSGGAPGTGMAAGGQSSGGKAASGGSTSTGAAGSAQSGGGEPTMGPPNDSGQVPVDQLDGAPATSLPPLPKLDGVVALQGDDSASIRFDPVDGAVDYRVYVLPADGDVSVNGDAVVVKDATYRCAGMRESPPATIDDEPAIAGQAINTRVHNVMVGDYPRTVENSTMGYVYTTPGPGRIPVYALGESDPNADSTCFFGRWGASRVKRYVTAESERSEMRNAFARDDGIVFYVPEAADESTGTVYVDVKGDSPWKATYYFTDPEAAAHPDKKPVFQVLKEPAPGTKPLMHVYYFNQCGNSHDELVVGKAWFDRVRFQGDERPNFTLLWTGITEPTTLVVEALDSGCPFQGHLSTESVPAISGAGKTEHQAWRTLDEIRSSAEHGEVFINGQHDTTTRPKAIARSFVRVKPVPHPKMDFLATFPPGTPREEFKTIPCGGENCYQTWRQESATFDQMFINAENGPKAGEGLFTYGPSLGEWWISYADVAADTNGKYRLTAKQKATMSADSYVHVTMEVDAYSTARRYPQILISDQDAPVQYGLTEGHTLVIQPRANIYGGSDPMGDYPVAYELQVCNRRVWDVNDQCPGYDLYRVKENEQVVRLNPNDEVGEYASADHRVLFDVYASTKRAYLFLEGKPYACANLPDSIVKAGPTTITWGDVLYHSAVDHVFAFHRKHMLVEQRRHFDNLGFSSGLPAPAWDEQRLPCAPPISL